MKDEAPADEPLPVEPVEKAEIDKQPPQTESSLEEAEAAAEEPAGPASYVGGTRVELTFPEAIAHEPLREMVQQQLDALGEKEAGFQLSNAQYQSGSEARYEKWTLRTRSTQDRTKKLLDAIQAKLADTPVFPSSSEIGGKVAGDTQMMAMYAMLASMVMIVIYVWMRFQK